MKNVHGEGSWLHPHPGSVRFAEKPTKFEEMLLTNCIPFATAHESPLVKSWVRRYKRTFWVPEDLLTKLGEEVGVEGVCLQLRPMDGAEAFADG